MDIYILQGREQLGPFAPETINDKLARGELTVATLAWFEGSAEWVPLGTVPGFIGAEMPLPRAFAGSADARRQTATSGTGTHQAGSAPEAGSDQTSADTADPQQLFYGQVVQSFQLATSHLMQPFDRLDEVVQANKPLNPAKFFRLFLNHAAKFNDDCTTAFATVLRQSTRVDAVRATTIKQLAKEIRAEAFEGCDEALAKYHQTVNVLMGGVEAAIEKADSMDAPPGPIGGALLGSLVAGKGSRAAGATVGGLSALAGAMATLNQQLALHGQALALIKQAERVAPEQVGEYLETVAEMPTALVDFLGAKCFGAAINMQAQQESVLSCVEHTRKLNLKAFESVRAMYRHLEQLKAEESRKAAMLLQEQAAKIQREKRIVLAVFVTAILVLIIVAAVHTDTISHENDAAHEEFERTAATWLLSHPDQTPSLPRQDVFDQDGYAFHRNHNGHFELWRHGHPVVHDKNR